MLKSNKEIKGIIMVLVVITLLKLVSGEPPAPHGIAGYVFNNNTITQVAAGTSFKVNNTNSGDFIKDYTGAGPFTGRYSVIINGNDGNQIFAYSWNATGYGRTNFSLAGDMDNMNIYLNATRASEANVTIFIQSNALYNITTVFNVTANITMLGANGTSCNATIGIANTTVIFLNGTETARHVLGNISLANSTLTVWWLKANATGSTSINVLSVCESDMEILESLQNSQLGNITVQDVFAPNITLVSPVNNTLNLTNNTVILWYNVSDASQLMNCSLMINSLVNRTDYLPLRGIPSNFTLFLANSQYNWSVTCIDSSGNVGNSSTFNLTVLTPDLMINSSLVVFIPSAPVENQTVNVTATIINLGSLSTGFIVQVFWESLNGVQLANFSMPGLGYRENATFNISFNISISANNIFVVIDGNNSAYESDENNNVANHSYYLSMWFIIYGNVTGLKLVDLSNNVSLSRWSALPTNLFITTISSNINWLSLQAIGQNTTNSTVMNDFAEIDSTLNTTGYPDSVNRTYTYSSAVVANTPFQLYKQTIWNVPIVNSTNSSNFVTGILWDTSDGGSEFDATQDLVFVTKTNKAHQGLYGVYDYEMKVPAFLRKYGIPQGESLAVYMELS